MIFSFFKKKKQDKLNLKIKPLMVDIHSHLIPSIDDGSKNLDESIALIRELKSIGYQKIITTPHIMSDAYKNSASNIYEGLRLLTNRLKEEDISIVIDVGAEYYLDEAFYDKILQSLCNLKI